MSMPPDIMTQLLQGNSPYGTNGALYSPLMGLAAGLLQAGGPSRMPVSLGQALGAGLQTGQQFQQAGLQNAMQQLMLGRTGIQLGVLQDALGSNQNQPNAAAQQAPVNNALTTQSATNGLLSPGMTSSGSSPIPNASPQPAQQPSSGSVDPYQDPIYIHNQKLAQVMDLMQPGSGTGYAQAASQRLDYLTKERPDLWQTLSTPEQFKQYGLPQPLPGMTYRRNTQTGEISTLGSDAIGQLSTFSPATGTFMPTLIDKRTGKPIGGSGSAASFDPSQPLPGTLESQAQAVANYEQQPPVLSSRNPSAGLILARARQINPDYDQTQYGAKSKAALAFTTGDQGKQLTAFNTAISHLQTLEPLIQNLNNTNTPAFNHLANFYKSQTGQAAPTNFATAKQLVAGEIAKAIAGGNMTEGDRDKANSVLNAANSPAQLQGAIDTIKDLMGGKLIALKTQYEAAGLKNFERKLEPASQQALASFEGSQQPQTSKVMTYNPQTGKIE